MTDELDPVVVIPATDRPIQVVDLVGVRYRVRRPKAVIEATPKTAILRLAAYFEQDSEAAQNRAERRAAQGAKRPQRIELTDEEFADGTEAVWRYLRIALADPGDYETIRRRVYGPDLSDEDAASYSYLEFEADPNPSDDIDTVNVIALVGNLMAVWSSEAETVKTNVRPPGAPKPAAKKAAGSTTKRPAKRPAAKRV